MFSGLGWTPASPERQYPPIAVFVRLVEAPNIVSELACTVGSNECFLTWVMSRTLPIIYIALEFSLEFSIAAAAS